MIGETLNREDQDISPDGIADRIANRLAVPVQPPKEFRVERAGSGLRLVAIDRGKFISDRGGESGADRYLFFWAESVDATTPAGEAAGFARATKIGDVLRAFIEDKELTFELTDGKFQTGYFYCVGSNPIGDISEYVFSGLQTNEIVDDRIPGNVTDQQVSESGELHNGTVVSAVAFQYDAPADESFGGVLFVLEDYPNLGEVTEYYTDTYTGPRRGRSTGKFTALPCRRVGIGKAQLTNGSPNVTSFFSNTKFTRQFKPGDLIEVQGYQGIVQTVTDDITMTLTANWTGPTSLSFTEWFAIGQVTIYFVPLSKAGTHAPYTQAKSVRTLFDAELSAPLSPSISAVDLGGGVRLYITGLSFAGTALDAITVYRGKGSGLAFTDPLILELFTWPANKLALGPQLTYDDFDFNPYDKEQGTIFSYYGVCRNVRGMASAPSTRTEGSPRLISSQDSDPTLTGRVGLKQMLYNAMLAGTPTNTVAETDTSQDAALFTDASNLPGKPYGGGGAADGTGRYQGYTRWHSTKSGGAASLALHQNGNEVKLPAPGAGQVVYLYQEIGAWDDGRAAFMKIAKNGIAVFSIYAKHNGTVPNGKFHISLEQYDNNTVRDYVPRRYRDTSNNLQLYAGAAANYEIPGSVLTSTWQRFYGVFVFDDSLGTTKQIRVTMDHVDSNNGGDLIVCKPMLNPGEDIGFWTADMGDQYVSEPGTGADPPSGIGDGDGRRIGRIPEA